MYVDSENVLDLKIYSRKLIYISHCSQSFHATKLRSLNWAVKSASNIKSVNHFWSSSSKFFSVFIVILHVRDPTKPLTVYCIVKSTRLRDCYMQKSVEMLVVECQRNDGINNSGTISICCYKVATKTVFFPKCLLV